MRGREMDDYAGQEPPAPASCTHGGWAPFCDQCRADGDEMFPTCQHGNRAFACAQEPCATEREQRNEGVHQRTELETAILRLETSEEARRIVTERKLERLRSEEGQRELADAFSANVASAEDLNDDDRKEILIDGFLDQDSFARIFGAPKTYKSFVTLDMAACVGTGTDWHGFQVTQTNVLYIVAEGVKGIGPRVRAWEAHYGKKMTGVSFYKGAVQIADENQLRQLIAFAKAGGYKFIIFDTQARCTVGVNESDNTEMGTIVAALDVVRTETEACVMLVHHSGVNEESRARGASSMLGAVDSDFECKRLRDGQGVKVVTKAQKDREYAEDLELDVKPKNASLVLQSPEQQTETEVAMDLPKISDKQAEALAKMAEVATISSVVLAQELGLTYSQRNTAAKYAHALMEVGYAKQSGGSRAPYEITDLGHRKLRQLEREAQARREQEYADEQEAERIARLPRQMSVED